MVQRGICQSKTTACQTTSWIKLSEHKILVVQEIREGREGASASSNVQDKSPDHGEWCFCQTSFKIVSPPTLLLFSVFCHFVFIQSVQHVESSRSREIYNHMSTTLPAGLPGFWAINNMMLLWYYALTSVVCYVFLQSLLSLFKINFTLKVREKKNSTF